MTTKNEQAKAPAGRRIGRWARALCSALALCLGLHGTLAQAQTVYFHNDPAGSPIAASDETGNLLWRESYRPYGERMLKPATANTQWFHGKQLDPDTGMEDFGARNYDPVLGRFLSIDPVDFTDKNIHSFNRYAYGNNNPLKFKDPDGRHPLLLLLFTTPEGLALLFGATATTVAVSQGALPGRQQWSPADSDARGLPPSVGRQSGPSVMTADARSEPRKDGDGASADELAASSGGPTAGQRVTPADRKRILDRDRGADGRLTCWRCGWQSENESDFDIGHKNVPRSKGGNLSDGNLACEGTACNRSAGNRGEVKPGSDCASKAACGR